MKLVDRVWQYKFDYHGIFECEFCGSYQAHNFCYDDTNFVLNVIPKIPCIDCGKNTNNNDVYERKGDGIAVVKQKVESYEWQKME